MPPVMWGLADLIEDAGYEAAPIGQIDCWRSFDDGGERFKGLSRPVGPGKAAPDVSVHTRIAAYLAGLGEFGWSKVFLTPQYGPRQRFGIVLTDMELEPDPLYDGPPLCNRCMACAQHCPADAISTERSVKLTLAGREVEFGEFDAFRCCKHFTGGTLPERQEDVSDEDAYSAWRGVKTVRSENTPFVKKPAPVYNTGQAVCGGKGCVRACMMSMEARGAIENTFHQTFRRRTPWSVDWSAPSPETDELMQTNDKGMKDAGY